MRGLALYQRRRIFAFTRTGDSEAKRFALSLGAEWAGDSMGSPPEPLDAAIIFAPAGAATPALARLRDGKVQGAAVLVAEGA